MTTLNEEICDLYRLGKIQEDNLGRFSKEVKCLIKEYSDKDDN